MARRRTQPRTRSRRAKARSRPRRGRLLLRLAWRGALLAVLASALPILAMRVIPPLTSAFMLAERISG